jgi:hypothetical protein
MEEYKFCRVDIFYATKIFIKFANFCNIFYDAWCLFSSLDMASHTSTTEVYTNPMLLLSVLKITRIEVGDIQWHDFQTTFMKIH